MNNNKRKARQTEAATDEGRNEEDDNKDQQADASTAFSEQAQQQQMAVMPPSPIPSVVIRGEPREVDVLLGRGSAHVWRDGNVNLYDLVEEYHPAYSATKSRKAKSKILQEIYDRIRAQGGRFLRKIESSNEEDEEEEEDLYVEVEEVKAKEKIGHTFRDRHKYAFGARAAVLRGANPPAGASKRTRRRTTSCASTDQRQQEETLSFSSSPSLAALQMPRAGSKRSLSASGRGTAVRNGVTSSPSSSPSHEMRAFAALGPFPAAAAGAAASASPASPVSPASTSLSFERTTTTMAASSWNLPSAPFDMPVSSSAASASLSFERTTTTMAASSLTLPSASFNMPVPSSSMTFIGTTPWALSTNPHTSMPASSSVPEDVQRDQNSFWDVFSIPLSPTPVSLVPLQPPLPPLPPGQERTTSHGNHDNTDSTNPSTTTSAAAAGGGGRNGGAQSPDSTSSSMFADDELASVLGYASEYK